MVEIWKPVVGFEGYYEISNLGRVRSRERYVKQGNHLRFVPGRIKKQNFNTGGYPAVTLCRNCKSKSYPIHRLIALAFIPNPDNKPFIDHINTDKSDYSLSNLRWVTARENANNPLTLDHSRERVYTPERSKKANRTKKERSCARAPKTVYQYTKSGEFVKEYDSINDAIKEHGGGIGIARVLDDITQSAGGYLWLSKKQDGAIYKRRREKNQRSVLYYNANGELLNEFNSISEASKLTGIPTRNILRSSRSNWKPRRYKFVIIK